MNTTKIAQALPDSIWARAIPLEDALKRKTDMPYTFKILENGCIVDAQGQEWPNLNLRDYDAFDMPGGAIGLVARWKEQILTLASGR